MNIQVDVQKIITALEEQRNEALGRLAHKTAYSRQLEERVKMLEAQGQKKVIPDPGSKKPKFPDVKCELPVEEKGKKEKKK